MKKLLLIFGIVACSYLNWLGLKQLIYYFNQWANQVKIQSYQNYNIETLKLYMKLHGTNHLFFDSKTKKWFFYRNGYKINMENYVSSKVNKLVKENS